MKFIPTMLSRPIGFTRRSARAFTLPEVLVVMVIFTLLFAVLVSCQIFGMRLNSVSETKLAATAGARKAMNQVRNEIRAGKILYVGTGSSNSFTGVSGSAPQVGNALQISLTTNTASFIRYYLDTNDNCLKRVTSLNTQPQILASFITNRLVFQIEDYQGNVLTTGKNNRVVRLMLEFYRWEYPIATIGNGGMYDYFRLQTRITRRTID